MRNDLAASSGSSGVNPHKQRYQPPQLEDEYDDEEAVPMVTADDDVED